jgi:uncharacterized protein with ATP-grasp and redox domains
MRTYLDCFPCFLNQALRAARIATDDNKKMKRVLDEVGMMLRDIPINGTPSQSGRLIYRKVREITRNSNPYREINKRQGVTSSIVNSYLCHYYSLLKM